MEGQTKELILQFGEAIGKAAAVYVPGIKKMTMTELIGFGVLLREGERDAALACVRVKMTNDELAAEAEMQADLLAAMADENYDRRRVAQELVLAILKASLGVLLTAVLF